MKTNVYARNEVSISILPKNENIKKEKIVYFIFKYGFRNFIFVPVRDFVVVLVLCAELMSVCLYVGLY